MSSEKHRSAISRRQLLTGAGAAGALAYLGADGYRQRAVTEALDPLLVAKGETPSLTLRMRRREDFLRLDFDFYNLQLDATDPRHPVLVKTRSRAGTHALVVVRFPPQNLLEQVVDEDEDPSDDVLPALPVGSRITGESRLAFAVDDVLPLPYDIEHLTDWTGWAPQIVPVAHFLRQTTTVPTEPTATQTAIEMPWWLYLSPSDRENWNTPSAPTTLEGRTDLWMADLHAPLIIGGGPETVQAVWALDINYDPATRPPATEYPFAQAFSQRDRWDIVNNTSVFTIEPITHSIRFTPTPVTVERLSLSSLGGWIDAHGRWNPPSDVSSLIDWRQRGTFGRDHYVRLINKGFLFPFGHPAVLIEISERKFTPPTGSPAGKRTAFLRRRRFLVVKEPDKDYGGDGFGEPDGGRRFPFTHVEVKTIVSPLLDPLPTGEHPFGIDELVTGDAFIPKVSDEMFRFHLVGTDWAGKSVEFTSPVVWVDAVAAVDQDKMQPLRNWFNDLDESKNNFDVRIGRFQGQRVHLAASEHDGDTAQPVNTIDWGAHGLAGGQTYTTDELDANLQGRFYPTLAQANVRLDAAEQISTTSIGNDGVDIELDDTFTDSGYTGKAGVYAKLVTATGLTYPGDRSGGVVIPNIQITGLSRAAGPVGGDLSTINADGFDPVEFFGNADATILGGIDLADICAPTTIDVDDAGLATGLPVVTTRIDDTTITTKLHFSPTLQPDEDLVFVPDGDASLEIDAEVVTDLVDPSNTTYSIDGDLRNFTVHLIDGGSLNFVDLHFSRLRFTSATDQKGTIDPQIDSTEFIGALAFLEELQQYLPFGDSGPKIEITPTQVEASIAVDLPSIAFGVFVLENVSFSAGVSLPFTGDPARARFAFSSREDPFHLTVAMFGGGGFFGLELGLDGVELFEVALEFGAEVSIDFGVASGGIHVYGGVYYALETNDDGDQESTLTAYIDLGGEIDIMGGVASASLEMYLGLTYEGPPANKVGGEASITIEVSVLMFSGSVEVSYERHFGADDDDPFFGDLVPPDDDTAVSSVAWNDYCAAFAGV